MKKRVFISYSRREYLFSESLALHLQHAGIDVWFDNQQIEPGENWQPEIETGLQISTALILVASRASISSPYVQFEWKYALKSNKPVYVMMFEAVDLPDELHTPSALIDFRTNFERGIKALLNCLREGTQHIDSMVDLGPRWLLQDITPGVRRVQLQLLFNLCLWVLILVNYLVFSWLLNPTEGVVSSDLAGDCMMTPFVLVAALLARRIIPLSWSFIHRTFSLRALQMSLIWMMVCHLLTSINILIGGTISAVDGAILVAFVPNGVLWLNYHQHPDFLRWCPLGEMAAAWRVLINQPLLPAQSKKLDTLPVRLDKAGKVHLKLEPAVTVMPTKKDARTFRLYYAPGDIPLADEVRHLLGEINHQEVPEDEPDYHVVIINPWTPHQLITDVRQQPNLICLLASTTRMSEELAPLSALQWIDYRSRAASTLQAAFLLLRDPSAQGRQVSSLNTQPAQLSIYVFPPELKPLYHWLRWIAAWTMAAGVGALAGLVVQAGRAEFLLLVLNLALIIYATYLFRLGDQIVNLKKPAIRIRWLGLLPVVIVLAEAVVLNLIYWQTGSIGSLDDTPAKLLATTPQIIVFVGLALAFWRAEKDVADKGLIPDHPEAVLGCQLFRTPARKTCLAVIGTVVLYGFIIGFSVIFSHPVIAAFLIGFIILGYSNLRRTRDALATSLRQAMALKSNTQTKL